MSTRVSHPLIIDGAPGRSETKKPPAPHGEREREPGSVWQDSMLHAAAHYAAVCLCPRRAGGATVTCTVAGSQALVLSTGRRDNSLLLHVCV